MIQIPRHAATKKLHEGSRTIVYEGRGESNEPVVIKCTKAENPRFSDISRLRHEFAVLKSLELPGVIKAHSFERVGNGVAMIMEAFDGPSLAALIKDHKVTLELALRMGAAIAATLSALHRKHVVHKDVKPANILVSDRFDRFAIVDFGIASWLNRESQRAATPSSLEGSLAYMSPEQTGRMNRMVDHRTDLYSLGVTLYESLTGSLPFHGNEPLDWIHAHIARLPRAPHELNPSIPPVVSAIVMKLLAKAPEERYQHAAGLKDDLDECISRLTSAGTIEAFPPGRSDLSDELSIPQKLYGRSTEIATLQSVYGRIAGGTSGFLVVSGYAGVGKSALVAELHKAVAQTGGYFVSGKLDQVTSSRPYSALGQAFNELVRNILGEPAEVQKSWRARIMRVLGANARLIIDLAPELETLIGPQPPVDDLPPTESSNRFTLVVQNFLRAFTAEGKPFVLFIDDLQWADSASLKLLRQLLIDPESKHLLIVGAYRDNEVDASHPLTLALEEIRNSKVQIEMIALRPLTKEDVAQLVADALESDTARTAPLSTHIFDRTHGNSLFVTQYLAGLHEDGLIKFDLKSGEWSWDMEQINRSQVRDNLVAFMTHRIERLPAESQRALQLAACIGHEFDFNTLTRVSERTPQEIARALWEPLREGLILPLDPEYRFLYAGLSSDASEYVNEGMNVSFRFLHDRAQQAAYSLIPIEQRPPLHYKIGRILSQAHDNKPEGDALFVVVNHLMLGLGEIGSQEERVRTATFTHKAGKHSKESAAHEPAARYYRAGLEALGESGWTAERELTLALHLDLAECEFLMGQRDKSELLFKTIIDRVSEPRERARILNTKTVLHTIIGEYADAQRVGREALRLLGVELPSDENLQAELGAQLGLLPQNLRGRKIEDLIHAQSLTDADQQLILTILTSLLPSSFMTNPVLYAYVICRNVNLSLVHGNSPTSIIGYVSLGYFLAGVLAQYDDAYKYGKLAIDLTEKYKVTDIRAKLYFLFAVYNHFYEPMPNTLRYFEQARTYGFEVGDFQYLAYTTYITFSIRFGRGDPLNAVGDEARGFLALMARAQDSLSTLFLQVCNQIIANLKGQTKGPLDFSDDAFDEKAFEKMLADHKNYFVACFLCTYKAQICYQLGRYEEALPYADRAEENIGSGAGLYFTTELVLFIALILTALPEPTDPEERAKRKERILKQSGLMDGWARNSPTTYVSKSLILRAEIARYEGRDLDAMNLYEEAIRKSRENDIVRDEALANELAGRFHLGRGRDRIARVYLTDAYYAYGRWNNPAKLKSFVAEFPFLADDSRGPVTTLEATSTTSDYLPGTSLLDAKTVVDVATAISSELILERLIERLMQMLIENAGAQRAILFLERGGRLFNEASITVNPDVVRVGLRQPLDEVADLPHQLVQRVWTTQEVVVLGDASADPTYGRDPYVRKVRARSVSCVPMSHQGRLAGVVYLENGAARDVFTPARSELVKVLASQAAVALENAFLYAELQQASNDLRSANETLEAQVTERTRELRNAMADLWSEMDIAKKIQTALLPERLNMRDCEIAGVMRPATTVGGDYFDVIDSGGRDWVMVGDVSGHGVPAGLIMMMVQTAVRTALESTKGQASPARLLAVVNRAVTPNLERIGKGQYMTAAALRFDGPRVTYSGLHEDMLLHRAATNTIERVETGGAWVGVLEDIESVLRDDELVLNPGDTLLLISDGVTESRRDGKLLADAGLAKWFADLAHSSTCQGIVAGIEARLKDYVTMDDVTVLAIRYGRGGS
jgi:predicted ATPase/serine phosphatase RsbU (regulator of sigma subunit)/tRNA A-37 threonylcarbamoyl transferase component Bud32